MRVSIKDLENLVTRLNEVTGNPTEYYTNKKINIGHYTLSGAYGGWQLQRTMNEGGGVDLPISGGYDTKRELYEKIQCYLSGINLK